MLLSSQTLGQLLKAARERKQITQTEAARLLRVSGRHYCDMENGKSDIRLSTLIKAVHYLDLDYEALFREGIGQE